MYWDMDRVATWIGVAGLVFFVLSLIFGWVEPSDWPVRDLGYGLYG